MNYLLTIIIAIILFVYVTTIVVLQARNEEKTKKYAFLLFGGIIAFIPILLLGYNSDLKFQENNPDFTISETHETTSIMVLESVDETTVYGGGASISLDMNEGPRMIFSVYATTEDTESFNLVSWRNSLEIIIVENIDAERVEVIETYRTTRLKEELSHTHFIVYVTKTEKIN